METFKLYNATNAFKYQERSSKWQLIYFDLRTPWFVAAICLNSCVLAHVTKIKTICHFKKLFNLKSLDNTKQQKAFWNTDADLKKAKYGNKTLVWNRSSTHLESKSSPHVWQVWLSCFAPFCTSQRLFGYIPEHLIPRIETCHSWKLGQYGLFETLRTPTNVEMKKK